MAVRAGLSLAFVLLLTSGGSAQEQSNPPLLPPPPPGPLVFAGTPPEHPFRPTAGNVFISDVFATPGPSNTRIEVRDVLVPPSEQGQVAALPGPAVLEVLQGQGSLSLQGEEQPLADGGIGFVPAGQLLAITNTTPRPMLLRLTLFEAG
jgi:quercetin dioxygenase-like cupin family protein